MTHAQNISRRTLVAGLGAAIPAVAVAGAPALANDDPIFAAIEAHRRAAAAEATASEARDEVEQDFPEGWAANPELRARWDADPAIQVAVRRGMAAMDAEENAFQALLATKPTTPAGLVALATYGVELDTEGAVCIGAPAPLRILAAIAGIPEENAPPDDDEG